MGGGWPGVWSRSEVAEPPDFRAPRKVSVDAVARCRDGIPGENAVGPRGL